mmetsp:Transcript_94276/g.236644  ORF Transcript_94276/g.236644 Transcript_94276/m.236644 type:complete len:224 (-) Transcript_94276:9-680(-)
MPARITRASPSCKWVALYSVSIPMYIVLLMMRAQENSSNLREATRSWMLDLACCQHEVVSSGTTSVLIDTRTLSRFSSVLCLEAASRSASSTSNVLPRKVESTLSLLVVLASWCSVTDFPKENTLSSIPVASWPSIVSVSSSPICSHSRRSGPQQESNLTTCDSNWYSELCNSPRNLLDKLKISARTESLGTSPRRSGTSGSFVRCGGIAKFLSGLTTGRQCG